MVSKKGIAFILISSGLVLLDQVVKFIFVRLGLYSKNYGAAFSILQNKTSLMIWAAIIVMGLILYYYDQMEEKAIPFAGLLMGGTISNMIDRIFLGYIIDFISLPFWPSFNIADIGITAGVIGIAWHAIKSEKKGNKKR